MFTLDRSHLVATLDAPFVNMSDWLIKRVAYDRTRRILELEMNTQERFQHFGVSRQLAVMLVKSESPSAFLKERIDGKFPVQTSANAAARTGDLIPHLFKQFVPAFSLRVPRILYLDPSAAAPLCHVWRMFELRNNSLQVHAARRLENVAAVLFNVIAEKQARFL
jgi:hypothetical protein